MLALLTIIAGSAIAGYSAYKIHAIRRGRGRKLRDMEILRRLDIPPKKQVRIWSALLVLGLVLLTPGLGYLLSVDPISGSGGGAPYSNLRATPSGTPATVPPSEELDKTPRIVEKDGSGSSGFFFPSAGGGGASSKRSSSGGGSSSSSTKEENTTAIEISPEGRDDDTRYSDGSYAHETNETSEITAAGSDPTDSKAGESSETKANDAELDGGGGETQPATLKDMPQTSAEIEPPLAEVSAETAIIGVSREKSTVPAFSGYLEENIVSEEILPEKIVSEEILPEKIVPEKIVSEEILPEKIVSEEIAPAEIGRGPDPRVASASDVVVETAAEKRTVPLAPKYHIDETVPGPVTEEAPSEPGGADVDIDEIPSPDAAASSDEFGSAPHAPSSETPGPEPESETKETPVASGASEDEDDPDLTRITSMVEDMAKSESPEIAAEQPGTKPRTEEVKMLVFGESLTPETNGTANLSAEKGGEGEAVVPNLESLFGDLNATSGSYVLEGGSDFMSRFQEFTSDDQTGMGTAKNDTLNPVPLLKFETIDLRSNFQSGSGLTPSSPFV
jgi:hypothetical protein